MTIEEQIEQLRHKLNMMPKEDTKKRAAILALIKRLEGERKK